METFLGILIPFVGTTLGAACVFFMKKSFGRSVQRSLAGFAAGDGCRFHLESFDSGDRAIERYGSVLIFSSVRWLLDRCTFFTFT